jgi:hypothetical protein
LPALGTEQTVPSDGNSGRHKSDHPPERMPQHCIARARDLIT